MKEDKPYEARTMSSINGTPYAPGYLATILLIPVRRKGRESNTPMMAGLSGLW